MAAERRRGALLSAAKTFHWNFGYLDALGPVANAGFYRAMNAGEGLTEKGRRSAIAACTSIFFLKLLNTQNRFFKKSQLIY